jgi:hypothetical protein
MKRENKRREGRGKRSPLLLMPLNFGFLGIDLNLLGEERETGLVTPVTQSFEKEK